MKTNDGGFVCLLLRISIATSEACHNHAQAFNMVLASYKYQCWTSWTLLLMPTQDEMVLSISQLHCIALVATARRLVFASVHRTTAANATKIDATL